MKSRRVKYKNVWEYGRIIKGRVANMHKAHNNKRKVIQGMKSESPFGTNYDIRKECDNVSGGLKEEAFRHWICS